MAEQAINIKYMIFFIFIKFYQFKIKRPITNQGSANRSW